MLKKFGAVGLLLFLSACSSPVSQSQPNETPIQASANESPTPVVEATVPASMSASPATTTSIVDKYLEAIDVASSAKSFSQSALTKDDWLLVADKWQEAIALLKTIPKSSANYDLALKLLPQYEQNKNQARQKSATFKSSQSSQSLTSQPLDSGTENPEASRSFSIPIIQKMQGVPVVEVIINGERTQMLLDTGASRTLITKGFSQRLSLQATGSTSAKTANGLANFDTVTLNSVQVGKIQLSNLSVAVGNDDMNYGLLGHDIYEGYDITLKEDRVVFEKR
jgi:clan AA aspartic protease (TIGR02281 family)